MSKYFEWPKCIHPPVYFANKQWAVTAFGLQCLTVERLGISRAHLGPRDIFNRAVQTWPAIVYGDIDVEEFVTAYREAVNYHRIKGRTLINWEATLDAMKEDFRFGRKWDELEVMFGITDSTSSDDLTALSELVNEVT